jgi:hypothetical protein
MFINQSIKSPRTKKKNMVKLEYLEVNNKCSLLSPLSMENINQIISKGGVILYSAIFQHTPPVQRTATFLAGHGNYFYHRIINYSH